MFLKNKRTVLFLVVFTVVVIFKSIELCMAEKWAIKEEDFSDYDDGIIVRQTFHTGTGWEIIGDSGGYYKPELFQDIIITPGLPEGVFQSPQNTFFCIAVYEGDEPSALIGNHIEFKKYTIIDWYPIYPVRRTVGLFPEFFYSKSFLRFDEVVTY